MTTIPPAPEQQEAVIYVLVSHPDQLPKAQLLIKSLRAWGGPLRSAPVWVYLDARASFPANPFSDPTVETFPLEIPPDLAEYWFAGKVIAAAQAESRATSSAETLIWMSCDTFIIQPPEQLLLDAQVSAALRPVHIRNIGLPADAEISPYWKAVYNAVGVKDVSYHTRSFVDDQKLRAYFNTHAFSINPHRGVLQAWAELYHDLVRDLSFQSRHCQGIREQVFLHQAVLSTLIASRLPAHRIRILPPEYNYPYNLHQEVPQAQKAQVLNDLVTISCEDRSLHPAEMDDIHIREPLRTWLMDALT